MFVDMIFNGQGHGPVGETLATCHFDPGLLRPYADDDGQRYVTANTGRVAFDEKRGKYAPVYEKRRVSDLIANGLNSPVFNATSLRKQEWALLDTVVIKAARARLRAWSDLAASNMFSGFNGMSKTVLEHETMSDPGEAQVDMDGLGELRTDAPLYQLEGLPLPITHSGFWFSERRLAVSRNTGTPLDTTMAEAAGRRVAESVEKTLIGTITGLTYGDSTAYGRSPTVYGYTNHPARTTKTDLTTPDGTNPNSTLADVLEMRQSMYDNNRFGPFMLYHSSDWDNYMDNDYYVLSSNGATAPTQTLRNRLRQIDGIQDVRRLDFLTNTYTLLLVQMTADVARAVIGMNLTTVQWPSQGGMRQNFKVMSIMVPQIRADYSGSCGIVHATTE